VGTTVCILDKQKCKRLGGKVTYDEASFTARPNTSSVQNIHFMNIHLYVPSPFPNLLQ